MEETKNEVKGVCCSDGECGHVSCMNVHRLCTKRACLVRMFLIILLLVVVFAAGVCAGDRGWRNSYGGGYGYRSMMGQDYYYGGDQYDRWNSNGYPGMMRYYPTTYRTQNSQATSAQSTSNAGTSTAQ